MMATSYSLDHNLDHVALLAAWNFSKECLILKYILSIA